MPRPIRLHASDMNCVAHQSSGLWRHPFEHEGTCYKVPGIHLCEPSPRRSPVIYQARASSRGREFTAAQLGAAA